MDVEIFNCNHGGYKPALSFGGWRVAYLTFAERFDRITYLERHLKTDEVFVLLEGKAVLYIGKTMKKISMEPHKIYNVKQNVWHNIKVSRNAKVLVVENDDTSRANTEHIDVSAEE